MRQVIIGNYTVSIEGTLPSAKKPVLLCIGSAPGGIEQALAFLEDTACDVAACNDAIAMYPGSLLIAASLHEGLLPGWVKIRKYRKSRPCVVANDPLPDGVEGGLDAVVRLDRACGSSGMYLALIGKALGYERIVLAGIQIEREGEDAYRDIWRAAKKKGALEGVESLTTGWLRQLLKGLA